MRLAVVPLASLVALVVLATPAGAQTACVTPNCVFGDAPALCKARAAPRTPTVLMTLTGNFVFIPADPRIEPGDCIVWFSDSFTHSSSGNACPDSTLCSSPSPPTCQFDSGNVSDASATPFSTCLYTEAQFPAGTGNNYYCRFHASPTVGTMRGILRVTSAIKLDVTKNIGAGSIELSWTGGGVTGDASYKLERQSGGDPTFPAGSTTTLNPNGGVLGTSFTDAGELSNPTTRYYLVRNKQTNEP